MTDSSLEEAVAASMARVSAARELITDISRWTQGASARVSANANPVSALDEEAACWCATGALTKQYTSGPDAAADYGLVQVTARYLFNGRSIVVVNDGLMREKAHANVLHVFDVAVQSARKWLIGMKRADLCREIHANRSVKGIPMTFKWAGEETALFPYPTIIRN